MIPMILKMRIFIPNKTNFRLWLPLFLLYPLLLVLLILLSPLVAVTILFLLIFGKARYLHFVYVGWCLWSALRGTLIEVQSHKGEAVYIKIV